VNIYEAERLANSDGERGQLVAQVALLNHKNDNFMRALEALKVEHEAWVVNTEAHGWGFEHKPSACPTCKLIAELEEVK
jgi:hypothetical protein